MMPVNCFVIKKNDILTLASLYSNTNKKKRKGENKLVYTFYELCWFFLIYSFAGWCAGVVANAVRNRKFVNTGFMNMPFCLSYGVCAVLCCIFLPELRHRIFFLFIGGALLAAFVSIMTGLILEHIFHRKWWDYSKNLASADLQCGDRCDDEICQSSDPADFKTDPAFYWKDYPDHSVYSDGD